MKDCDKNKEFLDLKYWDLSNSYGLVKSRKLALGNFTWVEEASEFSEGFKRSYNDESDEGYLLELGGQYTENLCNLPCLSGRMNIEKVEKIVANLNNKEE